MLTGAFRSEKLVKQPLDSLVSYIRNILESLAHVDALCKHMTVSSKGTDVHHRNIYLHYLIYVVSIFDSVLRHVVLESLNCQRVVAYGHESEI